MDCIGYTDRHRAAAARASGLPVLLSNDLVARVTGACLYEAS
jgi:protein AroM